ncbi:MAG: hypothetical protein AAGC95_14505 [Pseudomonadota bacterium]
MKSRNTKISRIACLCAVAAATALPSSPSVADDVSAFWKEASPILNVRYRLETVDQDGFADDALANTIRARVGFKTGEAYGFSLLADGEFVTHIGDEDYNSIENGQTAFPVVADPDSAELNRLQISYRPNAQAGIVLGRQRINLGNQRFVGAVGFRQNEQTYDAVRLDGSPHEKVDVSYIYANQVNRIFGAGNPRETFEGDIHLLDATVKAAEGVKVRGYYYNIDLDDAVAVSTATFGARVDGAYKTVNGAKLMASAELASQSDVGDNPNDVDLLYAAASFGAGKGRISGWAGFESLEGDGTTGFSTPLATLHKFNGFADAFLTTPADGLEDYYVKGVVKFGDISFAENVVLGLWAHKFQSQNSGADLGSEFDVKLGASFKERFGAELKYASYDGEDGPASRDKLWFALSAKY